MEKAMIVAGIGCRRGSSADAIASAIGNALAEHGLTTAAIDRLATGEFKRTELGISLAAQNLNVPLLIVNNAGLESTSARCLTFSEKSMKLTGAPSLSEAAALFVAGKNARLLGPRFAQDGVTCALAKPESDA
ncbi:cobalamin biosynthesis protein CbiG [Mesorhizobium denitrificans]|uniref:Cobalamin biosynthesis protein CbiG n=1 Tax=Mesorhizobium denitrificans TaxID=2294114 RepID=A0A371XGG3_9HYPH|nr:cobalamin biosynthesis protein CbiG [Mesorhizobium denitrificans]